MQNKWLFKFIRTKKKSEVVSSKLESEDKSIKQHNKKKEKLAEEKFFEVTIESENLKENISALSISSLKLKKQAKQEKDLIESEKKKSSDKFNLNELKEKIDLYAKKINYIGKKSLSSVLEMNDPIIEKNSIIFTLPSKASLSEFEKDKEYFTSFLQTELNNFEIKILSKIQEKKDDKYYSTPSEKLTKLIEINPLVGKFKDDLNLDL